MPEYGPSAIRGIFKTVNKTEPAVRDGGIVGDAAHGTGYHRSRNALIKKGRTTDYSIQDKRDKRGDGDAASAADLTMSDVLMRKLTARLVAAMKAEDPRIVGKLREFGGTVDSRNVTAYRVEDQVFIRFDKTHLWHIHLSVFREFCNDVGVCQGIAEVLLGISSSPYLWDGVSFPGSAMFYIGAEGPWVTYLGERLIAHGWTGYTTGAGPTFTEKDQAAVLWFQEAQGWTGANATGIPGPETWRRLSLIPSFPPPVSHPELYPEPTTKIVYEEKLVPGQSNSDSIWHIQNALKLLGFDVALTGAYDAKTIMAVKRYQESLRDDKPDGVLGPLQTKKLLADTNVGVQFVEEEAPVPPVDDRPRIRVATWNVKATNSLSKMKAGMDSLIKAGCDVICVQELSDDAKQKGLAGHVYDQGYEATARNSAVTIFWNDKTQKLIRTWFIEVNKAGEKWEAGTGGDKSIYKIIHFVELEDRDTGKRHIVMNNHIVPGIEKGGVLNPKVPIRLKHYRKQRDTLCEQFLKNGAEGKLVTAYGDMNVAWETAAGQDFEDALEKVGATVVWDQFPDIDTHGTRTIDWIVAKNGAFVSVESGGKFGSDHEQIKAEVLI